MATAKTEQEYSNEIETCAHHVKFSYWGFRHELTGELADALTEEAEDRAKTCIIEGYIQGELNCCYRTQRDGSDEEEIRGWWEIIRD